MTHTGPALRSLSPPANGGEQKCSLPRMLPHKPGHSWQHIVVGLHHKSVEVLPIYIVSALLAEVGLCRVAVFIV